MNPIKTLWQGKNADNAARRDRVAYPLTIIGIATLLPLLANELPKSDPGLGIQILFLIFLLALNGFALFRKKRSLFSHALVVIPMTAGVVMSVRGEHGFYAALFCYPAVIYFYAVLSRQMAHGCAAVMFAIVTSTIYSHINADIAAIFGATLLLTIIVVNLVFNALSDMTEEVPGGDDPFSNILAKDKMEKHLQRAIKNSKKHNTRLSGLRIELENYANIKTVYGQDAADKAIKGAALVIRKRLRNNDILFRYTESGFFALLPNTPEEGSIIASEQLRTLVLKAELAEKDMGCISIGTGEYVPDETPESWIEAVNDLVKTAINNGGNQIARRHPGRTAPAASPEAEIPTRATAATAPTANSI